MRVPLEITFRDVDKTEGLEELIREKATKLEIVCQDMISCRVAIEKPQSHQRSGSPYRVRINMRIPPGHEIVAERKSGEGDLHDPLPKVIRSAFEAADKQLRALNAKRRRDVKSHPKQEVGAVVSKLFPEKGYGFLRSLDGREIYFHRNSIARDEFGRLEVGTGVRFVESMGEEGPQASTVQIVDKPGVSSPKSDKDITELTR
ncbi:MAG: HPF/RaiA family ribosome-associated protein [Desulfobacteraceae bacterium]|nr:MAG: HPF/RaiA family ribosome-associated protein [Desulfobacteraceae bacterium]